MRNGNCIVLDDGDTCTCPQTISFSVCCKWFRWSVLPLDGTLEAEIFRDRDLKRCAVCAACSSPNPTGQNTAPAVPPEFTGDRKQKVNEKEVCCGTVRSEKSLDLSGSASTNRAGGIKYRPPRKTGFYTVHKTHYDKYHLYPSAGKGVQRPPGSRISSLKPPHSGPCPTRQRFCTPLSCAGQSYPARMGGRMTADGFSCITLSVKWSHCSIVAAESGEYPAGTAIRRTGGDPEAGLWKTQPHFPKIL